MTDYNEIANASAQAYHDTRSEADLRERLGKWVAEKNRPSNLTSDDFCLMQRLVGEIQEILEA